MAWKLYASHLGDYMKRWILSTPFGTLRVHKIMRSDKDRDLHDHPWDFTSFILWGRYLEVAPGGVQTYSVGSINRKRAEDRHRLALAEPVWTFVVTGPVRRKWGFYTDGGWVYWREYTGETHPESSHENVA
jgi:hypothetical protein